MNGSLCEGNMESGPDAGGNAASGSRCGNAPCRTGFTRDGMRLDDHGGEVRTRQVCRTGVLARRGRSSAVGPARRAVRRRVDERFGSPERAPFHSRGDFERPPGPAGGALRPLRHGNAGMFSESTAG